MMKSIYELRDIVGENSPASTKVSAINKDQAKIGLAVMERLVTEQKQKTQIKEEVKQLRPAFSVLG